MERNIQKELEELKMMKQMSQLTEQERKDSIYIPLCLEMVALDYLHHLRLMMFVPGNAEAKWLGRVIEENIREFEKALNTKGIKLTEPMIARNAKQYDEVLTGIMPRKFIFKADSMFTPYINAISNGIKEVALKQRECDKGKRLVKVGHNTWHLVSEKKYKHLKK